MHDPMRAIGERILRPLTQATERMLEPIQISPNDRLHLSLDDQGGFVVRPYARRPDGSAAIASMAARETWPRRIPERERLTMDGWWIAATDTSAIILASLWPAGRIEFADNETKNLFNYLIDQYKLGLQGVEQRARFRESGTLPTRPEHFEDHPDLPLNDYQHAALWSSLDEPGFAFFMEQGTGKTPIAIAEISTLARRAFAEKRKTPLRVLIVCPKAVRTNWEAEIERFATVKGRITVLRGTRLARDAQLVEAMSMDDPTIRFTAVICAYDTVWRTWSTIGMIPWDVCYLDESHYIKDPRTDRFKRMLLLRSRCERRRLLTGTPMCNSIGDLYSQLEFLGQNFSGFSSYKAFCNFYLVYDEEVGAQGFRRVIGYQNVPMLQERLARYSFSISKKQALPFLPDKVYDVWEVEMTDEQNRIYKELAEKLAVEIADDIARGAANGVPKVVTAQHVLVKLLRLTQITSGFVKYDDVYDIVTQELQEKGTIEYFTPNPKLDALREMVLSMGDEDKMIVWATFTADINQICGMLSGVGIEHVRFTGSTSDKDRADAQYRFNKDPKCKVLVGNAAAGGVGLNLVGYDTDDPENSKTNASWVVYYSSNWSMVHRAQSEDRAHRRTTRVSVRYTDLTVLGTIDEEIRKRVVDKRQNAEEVKDISTILKTVLGASIQWD